MFFIRDYLFIIIIIFKLYCYLNPIEWGIYDATGISLTVKNIIFKNGMADSFGLIGQRAAGWGPQMKDGNGNVLYWPIRSGMFFCLVNSSIIIV